MIKQSHVFFGHKAQGSIINSVLTLPHTISVLNPETSIIGLVSIILLLSYPYLKIKLAKVIPAPLVVVVVGIVMAQFFKTVSLVSIPTDFSAFLITPQFDVIFSKESLMAIFSLYFVASLESILSASAVDKLDPLSRESNFDRELWSKGLVNIACGLIGGLPIIAEIVRSSASISQGARSPLATFSHGIFILIFLLLFPAILNTIPLSALAAILILVGFRLAQPKQFAHMKSLGMSSFVSFVTTIIVTLAEDLLIGIFAGMAVKAIISLFQGASPLSYVKPSYHLTNQGDKAILDFQGSLVFFSALKQKKILNDLNTFKKIEINLTDVTYLDATSLSLIILEAHKMEKCGQLITINLPPKFQSLLVHIKGH